MVELMQLAFSPINVVFTLLLITVVIYWLVVILGVLDTDLFDLDMPEIDSDLDAGSDVNLGPGMTWGILHWFHVGEVPVTVLISIFVLSLWAIAILGNYYLNPELRLLQAVGVFVCNIVISSLVVKCAALPLRPLYALFYRDMNAPKKVIGSLGLVVTTLVTTDQMGQLEIHTKGAPIRLNVRSKDDHVFHEHDPAVIAERDKKSNVYFIVPPE
jgi:hypothetical protein